MEERQTGMSVGEVCQKRRGDKADHRVEAADIDMRDIRRVAPPEQAVENAPGRGIVAEDAERDIGCRLQGPGGEMDRSRERAAVEGIVGREKAELQGALGKRTGHGYA